MSIKKDINELLEAGILSQDTAQRIKDYYNNKPSQTSNRLLSILAILGSILIGMGIILILAHNWDNLSRLPKTIIAFIPLLFAQGLCFFSLTKRPNNIAWTESAGSLLFFGIGTCIAMVAQIYNISSSNGTFMLTWCLLSLPIIYLMRSSMVSLLYIFMATYYIVDTNGNSIYFLLLAGILPYYYGLLKRDANSNFIGFLNWSIPTSLLISISFVLDTRFDYAVIGYLVLFSLLYQFSKTSIFKNQNSISNGYKMIGLLGISVILLIISFNWFWRDSYSESIYNENGTFVILSSIFITLALFIYQNRLKSLSEINFVGLTGLLYTCIYFLLNNDPVSAQWISNLITFIIGIYFVYQGAKSDHLGILNYGLLLITALIVCRFFDSNLSFVLRGIIFILIGVFLICVNYSIFKKRKNVQK